MTAALSKAERIRRAHKQHPEWTPRQLADHVKTKAIQVVYDALGRKHGSRRGRPPVPAHKKRSKRQMKLAGVSTKRKAKRP